MRFQPELRLRGKDEGIRKDFSNRMRRLFIDIRDVALLPLEAYEVRCSLRN